MQCKVQKKQRIHSKLHLCGLPKVLVSSVFAFLEYVDQVRLASCSQFVRQIGYLRESSSPTMCVGGDADTRVLSLRVFPRFLTVKDPWDRDTAQLQQMTHLQRLIFCAEEVTMSCLFVSHLRSLVELDIGGALFFNEEAAGFFVIVSQLPKLIVLKCIQISLETKACTALALHKSTSFLQLKSLDICCMDVQADILTTVLPISLTHFGFMDNREEYDITARHVFAALPKLVSLRISWARLGEDLHRGVNTIEAERDLFDSSPSSTSMLTCLSLDTGIIDPATFFSRVFTKMPRLQTLSLTMVTNRRIGAVVAPSDMFEYVHFLDNHPTLTSLELTAGDDGKEHNPIVLLPRLPQLRHLRIPHSRVFDRLFTPFFFFSASSSSCTTDTKNEPWLPLLETLSMMAIHSACMKEDIHYLLEEFAPTMPRITSVLPWMATFRELTFEDYDLSSLELRALTHTYRLRYLPDFNIRSRTFNARISTVS